MAVLSPETLEQILGIPSEYIDCSGLKLHIDKIFRFKSYGRLLKDSKELPIVEEVSPENGVYRLEPGAYRIRYAELVKVPPNAIALAIPRSSLLRMGVTIYTAAWDPGYEGRGEGLMTVFNPYGIEIEKGAQVAQLIFIYMDRETKKLYRGTYYRENVV